MLKQILEKRITTKWWLPDAIETEKLDEVIDCAYLAPSKQGKFNHKIYVIGDSVEGRALKDYMFWEDTFCLDTVRGKQGPGLRRYNGQVTAPVVLVWIADKPATTVNPASRENDLVRVRDDCIVSATMAMCAAESLGLRTGFCGCIDNIALASKITGVPVNELRGIAIIAMGIGYGYYEPPLNKSVYKDSVYPITFPNTQNKTYPNAYELLLKNMHYILSEVSAFISNNVRTNRPGYSTELLNPILVEKCNRDCKLVLGAVLHDLQFNSVDATKTIASHYWNNGKIQVKRILVEKQVYSHICNMILNYIFTNTPFASLQTETSQYINTELVAEQGTINIINTLITIMLNALNGQDILPLSGNDFANVMPTNRTLNNRKARPTESTLVKYI